MKDTELTSRGLTANVPLMRVNSQNTGRRGHMAAILLAGSSVLGGCINVNAPAEPIVIELNINIRQEVIYRLAEDAGNTIEENADIF